MNHRFSEARGYHKNFEKWPNRYLSHWSAFGLLYWHFGSYLQRQILGFPRLHMSVAYLSNCIKAYLLRRSRVQPKLNSTQVSLMGTCKHLEGRTREFSFISWCFFFSLTTTRKYVGWSSPKSLRPWASFPLGFQGYVSRGSVTCKKRFEL